MAYSHSRLRNTLAVVRIATGILFLFTGAHKISSLEFARIEFPKFLAEASGGAAVGFYADFLNSVVWARPGQFAVLVGLTELFIGVGLVLGLVVRPISVLGIVYSINLMLATWMAPGADEPLWRYFDNDMKLILLLFLFVLFAIGHAGENWGVGSLYHHRRRHRWEQSEADEAARTAHAETPQVHYLDHDAGLGSKHWDDTIEEHESDTDL